MKKLQLVVILPLLLCFVVACNKVPKNPVQEEQKKVLKNKGRLVGDLASPSNMHLAKIQGVALVKGLADTGANEPPSMYQQMVLKELQRDIEKKDKARDEIASLATAIVILDAVVPPGAQKGDRIDAQVTLPPNSEATSIAGGYIDKASMHQYLAADTLRIGDRLGNASGFVLLDREEIAKKTNRAFKKGVIPNGIVVTKSRPVWLEIHKQEEQTVGVAQRIEDVINNRFSYKRNGSRHKVAEAKYGAVRINLMVPEEYKDNVNRYMNIVCAISFFETSEELNDRISSLKMKLLDPATSEFASVQLEAIGPNNPQVVEALSVALKDKEEMVRFNAAISIAYMNISKDRNAAANALAEFARTNEKLRPAALAVLGTTLKSSFEADSRLRELLSDANQETRYGAFRALWTRNPKDYMILGEKMGDQFDYHCLNCGGPPLIHLTKSKRPEVVLFGGENIFLQGTFNFDAGSHISIRSQGAEVIVKRYRSGIDEQRIVSYRMDDIIRAVVQVGGTYPDLFQFLSAAGESKNVVSYYDHKVGPCVLAVDALPGSAKHFKRLRDKEELAMADETPEAKPAKNEEKEKSSFMNPKTWFSSGDKDEQKPEHKAEESFSDD